jgi:tRNA A-37 threonylcarbamoyl transferase component Bud32
VADKHLHSLHSTKERLKGNNLRGPRQLCEAALKYFHPIFLELNSIDDNELADKTNRFGGFVQAFQTAINLLGELCEFITKSIEESQLTNNNTAARQFGERARIYATFNQRIYESISILIPEIEIDTDARRLEEMEEHLAIMLEDFFKEQKEVSKLDHLDIMNELQSLKTLVQHNGFSTPITGTTTNNQNVNLLVESVTYNRQGISLEQIYLYEPMPQHFDDDEHILGKGNFATTFRVKSIQDQHYYAMKQMKTNSFKGINLDLSKLQHEVRMLTFLNHDHIIRYFVSFLSIDKKRFNIVMELVEGGSLALKVDTCPSLVVIKKWLLQCLSALHYMHIKKHIWHRDIKPDNILLTLGDEDVKIVDLGLACFAKSYMSKHSTVGTLMYASYEKVHGLRYDSKDDIWGLGCVFAELLSGKHLNTWGGSLYMYMNEEVIARKQAVLQACQERVGTTEPKLFHSISMALAHNPLERPSASQWSEYLESGDGNLALTPNTNIQHKQKRVDQIETETEGSTESEANSGKKIDYK